MRKSYNFRGQFTLVIVRVATQSLLGIVEGGVSGFEVFVCWSQCLGHHIFQGSG